jgi:magnesium chelatase family protein
MRGRVESARQTQPRRSAGLKNTAMHANAEMRVAEIRQHCKLDEAGESLVQAAIGQMNLSACSKSKAEIPIFQPSIVFG